MTLGRRKNLMPTRRYGAAFAIVFLMSSLDGFSSANAAEPIGQFEYSCNIETNYFNDWLPRRLFFTTNDQDGTVLVVDSFIGTIHGGPVLLSFKKTRAGQVKFNWPLKLPVSQGGGTALFQKLSVMYKVKFDPSENTGKITILAGSFARNVSPGKLVCDKGTFTVFKTEATFGAAVKAPETPSKKSEKAQLEERWQRNCSSGDISALHRRFCLSYPEQN